MIKTLVLVLAVGFVPLQLAAEEQVLDLEKIEAELKAKPDDPMLHYDKCRALFATGKEQEAVDHAAIALAKFAAVKQELASMQLGSITTEKYNVEVHYNMGPKERAEKKDGIVRPYSFQVWTKDAKPKLVRTLDFEFGYFNGQLLSAAIGEMQGRSHANFGIVDPKSNFSTVKSKVLKLLEK